MRYNRRRQTLTVSRRQLALTAAVFALPTLARAQQKDGTPEAQARRDTLIIGLDIADIVTFDPARLASYTSPLVLHAAYDTLVTMAPGQYRSVVPRLATSWDKLPGGAGWRFTLDPAATFASGASVTPEDCRFSLDRARQATDGGGQFITNIIDITVSGPNSIDIRLRRADEAIMATLTAVEFSIVERAALQEQGRSGGATEWLNQHSAGSGPYRLTSWARRQSIQLVASPHPWRGQPGFRRISVLNIPHPAAQLRALERGDIDVAFNLMSEQIAALQTNDAVRIETIRSLDFVYLALTANPARNPALAKAEVRQAVGCAIDYEDLLGRLLGGTAVRPAHFLPIGVPGSTEATAARLGFHQDLDRARVLLRGAGYPDGFEMELAYGDDAIAGVTYNAMARKLQTDLGRVGIKLTLKEMLPSTLRADYVAGKLQAVLAFWNAPVIENRVWAEATVDRVGKRLGWTAPNRLPPLIDDAASATDPAKADALWADFQTAMVDQANLIVLFQPSYQVAVRNSVARFPLTAAGWMADLGEAKLA